MKSATSRDLRSQAAPREIGDLLQRFAEHRESYTKPSYNETQVRREFIDPLLKSLGWDIDNEGGLAEAYKDVVHEDALRVEERVKAPDYSLRVGGVRKFFLEAKKPSIDIRSDLEASFQLRRYAWSAKLSLSVLTNFEHLAIYDARIRPREGDAASIARVFLVGVNELESRWTELADILSKDAVLKGSFDKFATSTTLRRGTSEVDEVFLEEIEEWRKELAHNIALRNLRLTARDLNAAVQATIDRIVFLRICEDRGLETYGQLKESYAREGVYKHLIEMFHAADEKYNSGLFHFRIERGRTTPPDTLTTRLKVDDRVLKDILRRLYYPVSPYAFAVIPIEILGQAYERFLGSVIRLTPGHRASVQEKPEVRKAGGVYYTPAHVVRYIVNETLGVLLSKRALRDIATFRVLDPACGSGSFLLGAFQALLDWHLHWYEHHDPASYARGKKPEIYQGSRGQWRLTTEEKKRILTTHIFGVDIDPQAVEVTKLSLLLKVLEGESAETLGKTLSLYKERALPDLDQNIKCGNSLIENDYYAQAQLSLLEDDEEQQKVNAFDWKDAFPRIMANHGFDAVIGNPPYVLLQDEFRDDKQLDYFRRRYRAASYKLDTYHLFIERAISLTKPGGRCAMITPANLITNNHLAPLRHLMLEQSRIHHILVIEGGVFDGVSVDNAIFVVEPGHQTTGSFTLRTSGNAASGLVMKSEATLSGAAARKDKLALLTSYASVAHSFWKRVLARSLRLGDISNVNFGKQLRDRKKFPRDVIEVSGVAKIPKGYVPCYTGRDVSRYLVDWNRLACLDDEKAQRGGCWDREMHEATGKLVTRQIGRYPEFAMDSRGYHCLNTMFMVNVHDGQYDPLLLLAVLNSSLTRGRSVLRSAADLSKDKGNVLEAASRSDAFWSPCTQH